MAGKPVFADSAFLYALVDQRDSAHVAAVRSLQSLDRVEATELLRLDWIGSNRFEAAKSFFRKHADHGYSFTDCTSFILMHELGISDALTTDHHFVEAGFRSLFLPSK